MKHFLFIVFIAFWGNCLYAQNKFNLSEIKSMTNYGIDYTKSMVEKKPDTNIGLLTKTSTNCLSPNPKHSVLRNG